MTAAPAPRPVATATAGHRSPFGRIPWPLAVVLSFAVGATVVIGWNALTAGELQPGPTIAGTISVVNHDGSAVCLMPDGGGRELCTTPFLQAGSAPLTVGQHVTGRLAQLKSGAFTGEVFIVTSPGPH